MDPFRFVFSVKAEICPTAIDFPAPSPMQESSVKFDLPPDASSHRQPDLSGRLISYFPRSGMRLVFTRMNLSDLSPPLSP